MNHGTCARCLKTGLSCRELRDSPKGIICLECFRSNEVLDLRLQQLEGSKQEIVLRLDLEPEKRDALDEALVSRNARQQECEGVQQRVVLRLDGEETP